jgi:replicative DNA helicase
VAECIVSKNRHGETDTVKLVWDGKYTRFSTLERFRDGS